MSLLRPPANSLDRARWYCLVACVANIAGLAVVAAAAGAPPAIALGEELALAAVGLLLAFAYRQHGTSLAVAAGLAGCLFLCACLDPEPGVLSGLLVMTVCFVSLDERARHIVIPVALVAGSYLLAATVVHPVGWVITTRTLAAIPALALVFASFASVLGRFERALAAERVLADASAALAAATDPAAVYRAAVEGCHALIGGGAARATLWLLHGKKHELAASAGQPVTPGEAEQPGAALHLHHTLPLESRGGRKGVLIAAVHGVLPEERLRIATAFARQVALALETVELLEQVRAREAHFRSIVQHTSDVIVVLDEAGRITFASQGIEHLFATQAADVPGRLLGDLFAERDRESVADMVARAAGGHSSRLELSLPSPASVVRHVELRATNLLSDPNVQGIVLVLHDVSERKTLERRLERQAFNDSLTGLANRAVFLDRLRVALARATRTGTAVAVLFVDLDNFKTINDTFGHAAGDATLVAAGARLRGCLREMDTAARLGGDELAAIIENTGGAEDAVRVAERALAALQAPIGAHGREINVSASIGIALSGEGVETLEELLGCADLAMYEAKRRGKNCCVVADPGARGKVQQQLELQTHLRQALRDGALSLAYRPMVSLLTRQVVGVEALPRWNHPRRRALLPTDIMAAAESIGAAHTLGNWALTEACQQVMHWTRTTPAAPLVVSVRVLARHLARPGFVEETASIMSAARMDPRRVILELTAGAGRDSEDLSPRLRALKEVGVRLAIDGLGTGKLSLVALPQLPLDLVKIDKAFVDSIDSADGGRMAYAIATLGRILRLEVMAEGIERGDQVDTLRGYGCELGAGRYFSPPLPADAMTALLNEPRLPVADVEARSGLPE